MARRLSTEYPFTCVTCDVEIVGPATFHVGLPFCCAGCVANGPCRCSYDVEPDLTDGRAAVSAPNVPQAAPREQAVARAVDAEREAAPVS